MLPRLNPFEYFTDTNGDPLDGGYVYIGSANQNPKTSPITVYFDLDLTIPAPQPLRTIAGRIVRNGTPATIYSNASSFSVLIENKSGQQVVFTSEAESSALAGPSGSSLVGFLQSGTGAIPRTLQSKCRETISVKDFGDVGDPSAIINAVASSGGKPIVLNDGIHGGHAYDPGHPSEEIRIVGGAIRRDAGSWAPINDSGHDPFGITTITEQDAYTLRVNFNGDNTKVGTLLAAVDAELAPYGIIGGCSCNANYADFKFYAPVIVDLQNNTTPSVAPWLASYVTLNTSGTYSTTINHPPRALNVDPPGVTLINRVVGAGRIPAITWTSNTTTISAKGHLGALIQRTGASTFTVSQQTTAGTVTTAWSAGALTITHPDCGASGSIPLVWSHNSAYRAEVVSFTSTTVVVQFRNSSGAVVGPSDDAEMKVWFERSNALFDTPMPSGFSARVDLGYLAVPLAAIQNISLNNFWLFGAMIK